MHLLLTDQCPSITLDLSDTQFQKLQDLATIHGIAIEVLLKASLED